MPIPAELLSDPVPGNRVARVAREAAITQIMMGVQGNEPLRMTLDKMICWNAAAHIASLANGINLPTTLQDPTDALHRLFANWQQRIVANTVEVSRLPSGCFIGFIQTAPAAPVPKLRHAMLHTLQGTSLAAGTNNTGIFPLEAGNWSLIHLNTFFTSAAYRNEHTQMVFTNVTGQTI